MGLINRNTPFDAMLEEKSQDSAPWGWRTRSRSRPGQI